MKTLSRVEKACQFARQWKAGQKISNPFRRFAIQTGQVISHPILALGFTKRIGLAGRLYNLESSYYPPTALLSYDGRIIYMNPASRELFGTDAAKPHPHITEHVVLDGNIAIEGFTSFLRMFEKRAGKVKTVQAVPMHSVDGRTLYVEVRLERVGSDLVQLQFSDLTGLHNELEAARSQTAQLRQDLEGRDKACAQTIGKIHHEYKNFLNTNALALEDILEQCPTLCPESKTVSAFITQIVQGIRQEGASSDLAVRWAQLFVKSKLSSKDLILEEALHSALMRSEKFAKSKSIRLAISPRSQPEAVALANSDALGYALSNLLHNAIKFTPSSGCVELGARVHDSTVLVWVQDNGSGIAPERLSTLFDKGFERSTPDTQGNYGTGEGLPGVRELVEKMGGSISVASTVGEGSTFTISLPRSTLY